MASSSYLVWDGQIEMLDAPLKGPTNMAGPVGHILIHSGQAGIWIQVIVPEDSIFLGKQ